MIVYLRRTGSRHAYGVGLTKEHIAQLFAVRPLVS